VRVTRRLLRTRVREYLRSHRSVLAYADAPSSDGGPGAVYVLRRKYPVPYVLTPSAEGCLVDVMGSA